MLADLGANVIKVGARKLFEILQEKAIQRTLKLSDEVLKTDECQEGIDAFFE